MKRKKRIHERLLTVLLILAVTLSAAFGQKEADLVLLNGKVVTVDSLFSVQQAVAVCGDSIVYVGTNSGAQAYITSQTRILRLDGTLVLPGLIDAHAHLHSLGEQLSYLDISGCASYAEIISGVAERTRNLPKEQWIVGGRWDHTKWSESGFPHHKALSAVSPHHPVYLRRVDGNSALVNQKAMDLAGITKETPDPFGGVIQRGDDGQPTGVLINQAMNLVKKHLPEDSEEDIEKKFKSAVAACVTAGLTGVHEAGVSPREIALYRRLIDRDELDIRLYAMLGEQENPVLTGDLTSYFQNHRIENYGNHFLSVRSIKLFFDGALGSRGAAFFEPYTDDPENRGLLRITPDYITRVARAALQANMGVNTHCIGIRGNRLCLDAYEAALREFPGRDHRFRIEHAQVVREEDVQKFARLGVIPSMQPTHCTSDMDFVETRIGTQRAEGAYAWQWFRKGGLIIPMGSDFPVESHNPLTGIYAAVTRQDAEGNPAGGWHPGQRLSMADAIRGYTIWAAYAAFQEDILGSIEVGKLADFTILDRDLLTIQPREILGTQVLYTIVAGRIRYDLQEK